MTAADAGCIDGHQHFWRYDPADYGWIDEPMAVLRRDFLPADLEPLRTAAGVDGTIAVQARQSPAETRFLLELARDHPWIRGVVGWIDLCADDVSDRLLAMRAEADRLAGAGRLCGLRHVLQAEPADYALRPAFRRGITALAGTGLVYDLLVFPPQLEAVTQLCRDFPQQPFVLDHCGKPDIRGGELRAWSGRLRALAALPNVCCKLSGLVTEARWDRWTAADLQPCFETALDAFGPERLLFGSDWPVCTVAAEYRRWIDLVRSWLQPLPAHERQAVLGGNAARVYRLGPADRPVS